MSSNDNIKPQVARLMFESYPMSSNTHSQVELPYDCVSMPGSYQLNGFPMYEPPEPDPTANLVDMNMQSTLLDPATAAVQSLGHAFQFRKWQPSINTVREETEFDLNFVNEVPHYQPMSSRKRMEYRKRQERQHFAAITAGIKQMSGIYKANISVAQEDNGANRTVTNNKALLVHFKSITPYPINGVSADGPAIHCTGIGYLPWKNDDGQVLLIRCYYSDAVSGTIISPNDVVRQYSDKYSGYEINNNFDTKTGTCKFIARDGLSHLEYSTYMENSLWYHYLSPTTTKLENTLFVI